MGVTCLTIVLIRNCAIIEPLDHGCGRQNSKMASNFLGLVYIHLLPDILSNTNLGTAIKDVSRVLNQLTLKKEDYLGGHDLIR